MHNFIVPEIVAGARNDEAAARIRYYYTQKAPIVPGRTQNGRPLFSGARFDYFAPDRNPRDAFTGEDLLATGLLSVHVPGAAIIQFLEHRVSALNELLAQLPADVDLGDLNRAAFDQLLGRKDSPGFRLWDALRGNDIEEWLGVGETITSKLLARKRPRLIPIWDSVIKTATGLPNSREHWECMWHALVENDHELSRRLRTIREQSGETEISLLRTFDVAVWHAGTSSTWSQPEHERLETTQEAADYPEHIGIVPGADSVPLVEQ